MKNYNVPTVAVLNELSQHLIVKSDDLAKHLEEQATLYFQAADLAAKAISLRDEAKDKLSTVASQLNEVVRLSLADQGEKVTEARIDKMVPLEAEYIEASNYLRECKKLADRFTALKVSFEQRSSMVRGLIDLVLSDLHSKSSVKAPSKVTDIAAESTKKAMAKNRPNLARKKED